MYLALGIGTRGRGIIFVFLNSFSYYKTVVVVVDVVEEEEEEEE